MKRLIALLLACLMLCLPAAAEVEPSDTLLQARDVLGHLGFSISDESISAAVRQQQLIQQLWEQAGFTVPNDLGTCANLLLCQEGWGEYNYLTMTWTPTSDQVYAFDAEVFNVAGMYAEFLQGAEAIIPGAQFTDVQEDLSGMTAAWDEENFTDGYRSVSFLLNGKHYETRLVSYGDWFNDEFIGFVNDALEAEGFSGQLHCVSDPYDQIIILIYGDRQRADVLRQVMGVPEPEPDEEEPSLLNWLVNLLGF